MNPTLFLPLLGELLAKSAILIVAAMLIVAAWKRASASSKHFVWCVTFVAILLLPATLLCRPTWAVPVIRIASTAPVAAPRQQVPAVVDRSFGAPMVPLPPRKATWQWPDWRVVLLAAWAVGAGLVVLRRLVGSVRLHRLRGASERCTDARIATLARELLHEQHVRRSAELRISARGSVPITWGTFRPVLLLPQEALRWSDEHLTAALRHEIGHIARLDHLSRWMSLLACALYWPNPLVWFAARSHRTEQEKAADDVVLAAGTDADEYVGQLFEVARSIPPAADGIARCAVAMATPSTLERRMLAIVDEQRDRRPLGRRTAVLGILTAACAVGMSMAGSLLGEEKSPNVAGGPEKGPAILIEAKIIELERALPQDNAALALLADGQMQSVAVNADKYAALIQALSQSAGADIISAPKLITWSDQKATVEIGNEFRYATEWEKRDGKWTPTKYDTQKVGLFLTCTPTLLADGSILSLIDAGQTVFLGFRDLDAPAEQSLPAPAGSDGKLLAEPINHEGRRVQAIFRTRRTKTSIRTRDGQTAVIRDLTSQENGRDPQGEAGVLDRQVAVFVTSKVVKRENPTQVGNAATAVAGAAKDPNIALDLSAFSSRLLGAHVLEDAGEDHSRSALPAPNAPLSFDGIGLHTSVDASGQHQTQPVVPKPSISIQANETRWSNGKGVASGDVEIDTGTMIIRTGRAEFHPKPTKQEDPAAHAIIPRLDLREAGFTEAVQFIARKAREISGKPLNVVIPEGHNEARITLSLQDIPAAEALTYVANLAGSKLVTAQGQYHFESRPASAPDGTPPSALAPREQKPDLLITVGKGGRIQVTDRVIAADQLQKTLADAKQKNPELRVKVSAAADVPYGEVQVVMNALRSAGVSNVTFANQSNSGTAIER